MANGGWEMTDGKCQMTDGKCQMTDGKCQMTDGKCQMTDDRWQMEHGRVGHGWSRLSVLIFLGVRIEFSLRDALELPDERIPTPGFARGLPCGVVAVARIDRLGVLQRLDPTAELPRYVQNDFVNAPEFTGGRFFSQNTDAKMDHRPDLSRGTSRDVKKGDQLIARTPLKPFCDII